MLSCLLFYCFCFFAILSSSETREDVHKCMENVRQGISGWRKNALAEGNPPLPLGDWILSFVYFYFVVLQYFWNEGNVLKCLWQYVWQGKNACRCMWRCKKREHLIEKNCSGGGEPSFSSLWLDPVLCFLDFFFCNTFETREVCKKMWYNGSADILFYIFDRSPTCVLG